MGWRFPTGWDKQALETWLRTHGAPEAPTEEESCERAYARLRELGLELAADKALQRMVRAALHGFFHGEGRWAAAVRGRADQDGERGGYRRYGDARYSRPT
jgi:hypothetical protein